MVIIWQQPASLEASGARTSDWMTQVIGSIIYAYDLSAPISEGVETVQATGRASRRVLTSIDQSTNPEALTAKAYPRE